jgi:hypothetical protein
VHDGDPVGLLFRSAERVRSDAARTRRVSASLRETSHALVEDPGRR